MTNPRTLYYPNVYYSHMKASYTLVLRYLRVVERMRVKVLLWIMENLKAAANEDLDLECDQIKLKND